MEFIFVNGNDRRELLSELLNANEVGLDVETTSLDIFGSDLLLVQLEVNNKIFVIDVRKVGKEFIKYIVTLIKDSNKLCIGHQIKFDIKILFVHTGELITNVYDTMVAETLINQGIGKQFYSLKELAEKYCNAQLDKAERASFIEYTGEITNEQIMYAAMDVKYLKCIRDRQVYILISQGQERVLALEMRVEAPIASMELNGVLIDVPYWKSLTTLAIQREQEIERKIKNLIADSIDLSVYKNLYEVAEEFKIPVHTKKYKLMLESITDLSVFHSFLVRDININSHSQMLNILQMRGLPITSTGEEILKEYKNSDQVVKLILDYREQEKRRSTYGDTFTKDINPITGRFHAEFHQTGTSTGRLSASRIHQIPRNKDYRRAFIARDNYSIITADYSQQEYRIVGAVSGEQRIIDAYLEGKDMHTATAGILFNRGLDDVTKDERDFGKTFNFATLYGSTEWGLSRNLGIPVEQGRELLSKFWKGYPDLYKFKRGVESEIWKHMYSVTPLGRKRYFENRKLFVDDKDRFKYEKRVKREGFNHIIQGCGADIIKIAKADIYYNNPFGSKLFLYLQAHDEIATEVDDKVLKDAAVFIEECMLKAEQPFLDGIPAKVDYNIEKSWTKG